mmetsp:Transcript_62749/g.177416  ORF Transcript_62749/g.177416 Transcript_62749/m.177416 type:complete len:116 (-) Transcript_62749:67-414(-)
MLAVTLSTFFALAFYATSILCGINTLLQYSLHKSRVHIGIFFGLDVAFVGIAVFLYRRPRSQTPVRRRLSNPVGDSDVECDDSSSTGAESGADSVLEHANFVPIAKGGALPRAEY